MNDVVVALVGCGIGGSAHIGYDELVPAADASSRPLPIGELVPGVPGPLCLEHVVMQNEALAQATESGAQVRRGITDVRVAAGGRPSAAFVESGGFHERVFGVEASQPA